MATKTTAKKDAKESIKKTVGAEKAKTAAKKALVVDPYEEKKKAEKARVKASAAEFIKSDLVSEEYKQKYADLVADIEEKTNLLNNLYGIEAEAVSMAELVNAHNVLQAELDAEAKVAADERLAAKNADEAERKQMLEDLKAEYDKAKKILAAEQKQYESDLKVAREREQAEFDYNLKRERSKENDAWADQKAAREKELATKEANLAERIAEITAKEASIAELEAKVAEIPELVKKATEEGKAAGKKEAETSHVFEKRAMEKQNEFDKTILSNKIELQENTIGELQAKVASLEAKLDAAYTRNQELATTVAKNSGVKEVIRAAEPTK